MQRLLLALAPIAALLLAAPVGAEAPSIEGNWKSADGNAVVRIAPCGTAMCGRILELLAPAPPGGAKDARNPDVGKRGRGLIGLKVLWNLAPGEKRFEGKGYSPERGRYFDAEVWRDGDRLRIKGCVKLICQTQTLTRA